VKKTLVFLILLTVCTALFAQQKFALVIGNADYTTISKLRNPVNDANDITAALQRLGFTVDKLLNATQEHIDSAVTRLRNRLSASKDSYGFLFYAGHGVQFNGENYLLPVDINIDSENRLRYRAVAVQSILDELNDAGNSLNIIVLDACRDNPFGLSRSASRGLGLISRQPAESIIVYATSAGSVASDGTGRNGLFTTQLLRNLIPGLEVGEIFRRTGAEVSQASRRQQIPAVYTQFFGTAYLGGTGQAASQSASAQTVTVVSSSSASASAAVGSIQITSEIAGIVMVDNVEIGSRIKAGGTLTVTDVSVGSTEVAVKKDDGKVVKAPQAVMVRQGQTANISIMEYIVPNWVQTLPQTNDRMAYFVGRSERMENYENYLEAKSGAMMDVLIQFSIYKNAEIQVMSTDFYDGNNQSLEYNMQINANNNSTGLYQQAEWMAEDGTLYVLYTYSSRGRANPRPDFPVFFRDYQLRNDRIYFTAKAVSKDNTNELSVHAEQNVRMQIFLWLGSTINGTFINNNYTNVTNISSNTYYGTSSFETNLKCITQINIQSLSFQEEARHIQIEQDKKYHFYGLYSISNARPGVIREFESFSYYAKYENTYPASREVLQKNINFNGNRFTQNRPYVVRQTAVNSISVPVWISEMPPEDLIWGIGTADSSSMEIQNVMATIRSVTNLAEQVKSTINSTIIGNERTAQATTKMNISKFIKINSEFISSGTWQKWQLLKADIVDLTIH